MLVGVDNYSFHRLLGEVRAGEWPAPTPRWGWEQTVTAAREAGAQVVALETCFMEPDRARQVLAQDQGIATMLSWGHPYGLEYGSSPTAEADARRWLAVAAELGHRRMRVVVAHPRLRSTSEGWAQVRASAAALARLATEAESAEVTLCVENHADMTARQLAWLVEAVGSDALAVCFDIVNATRVGDDPGEAAAVLGPWAAVAHVKDIDEAKWHPISGPTSVPLGRGVIPVSEVVDTLLRHRADCWLLVELAHIGNRHADELAWVADDIRWIRAHVGGHGARRAVTSHPT